MKKLLLLLVLMFTVTLSAQTIRQTYTQSLVTDSYGNKGEWHEANFTVVIYEELRIDFEVNNKVLYFDIVDAFEGRTVGGYVFYQLELEDIVTREKISLQVFDDQEKFGIRIFILKTGDIIQYLQ